MINKPGLSQLTGPEGPIHTSPRLGEIDTYLSPTLACSSPAITEIDTCSSPTLAEIDDHLNICPSMSMVIGDDKWKSWIRPGKSWRVGECIAWARNGAFVSCRLDWPDLLLGPASTLKGQWSFYVCLDGIIRVFVSDANTVRKMTAGSPLYDGQGDTFTLPEVISLFRREEVGSRHVCFDEEEFKCLAKLIQQLTTFEHERLMRRRRPQIKPSEAQELYERAMVLNYAQQNEAFLLFPDPATDRLCLGHIIAVVLMDHAACVSLRLGYASHDGWTDFEIAAELWRYGIHILEGHQVRMRGGEFYVCNLV